MYGSFVRFKLYKNNDVKAIKRLRMYIYDSMKKIKGIGYPKVFLKLKVIKNKYIIDIRCLFFQIIYMILHRIVFLINLEEKK